MKGEFYKMDFRAWNVGTVDLTLEQEGAYLRLCHAMYDVGGPVPNSTRFLQSIFRCGNVKAATLVSQLISAGKIAVTKDGGLFNHRVSEELAERERVSAVRRAAGEKGGTADRSKPARKPSEGRVTPEWVPSDPRVTPEWLPSDGRVTASKPLKSNNTGEAIASTPRSREEERRGDQVQASPSPETRARGSFPSRAFECFWDAYPHKVGKDAARTSFERVRQSGRVSFPELMAGLDRYVAGKPVDRSWCNPATWLNQGRWADAPAPSPTTRSGSTARPVSSQQRALDLAKQAHLELMDDPDDPGPFAPDASARPADGGYSNGHAGSSFHEPAGGQFRLAPPRPAGPSRPH